MKNKQNPTKNGIFPRENWVQSMDEAAINSMIWVLQKGDLKKYINTPYREKNKINLGKVGSLLGII
jgi:hypothetical protein